MCQVCENPYRICQWGNNGVYIDKTENGEYRFKMIIDECVSGRHTYYESLSTPISYCPFCGNKFKTPETKKIDGVIFANIIEYIKSLDTEKTYDKWRYAHDLWVDYHKNGKNPDEHMDEFIAKVEKYK